MYEFSVLIRSAPDVDGEWIAHCLNWDVVTQGRSPSHAVEMICEALVMAIEDDLRAGLDPHERREADQAEWDSFAHVLKSGRRVSEHEVEQFLRDHKPSCLVVAAKLFMVPQVVREPLPMDRFRAPSISPPDPFIIAALEESNGHAYC